MGQLQDLLKLCTIASKVKPYKCTRQNVPQTN